MRGYVGALPLLHHTASIEESHKDTGRQAGRHTQTHKHKHTHTRTQLDARLFSEGAAEADHALIVCVLLNDPGVLATLQARWARLLTPHPLARVPACQRAFAHALQRLLAVWRRAHNLSGLLLLCVVHDCEAEAALAARTPTARRPGPKLNNAAEVHGVNWGGGQSKGGRKCVCVRLCVGG